jgi:hypothetical protein
MTSRSNSIFWQMRSALNVSADKSEKMKNSKQTVNEGYNEALKLDRKIECVRRAKDAILEYQRVVGYPPEQKALSGIIWLKNFFSLQEGKLIDEKRMIIKSIDDLKKEIETWHQ